jgi:hypothetical protein
MGATIEADVMAADITVVTGVTAATAQEPLLPALLLGV